MNQEYICKCSLVTQEEIEQAILEQGVTNLDQLKDATYATAGCGKCRWMCQSIIDQNID